MRRKFYSPFKPMKNIWINEHHDSDWDGVPNFRDCEPFNPNKHGISRTKREQLKKAPIYLTDEPLEINKKGDLFFEEELYKSHEKKGKKYTIYSSSVLRSLQKNYPGLIKKLSRLGIREVRIHGRPSKSKAKLYPLGFATIDGNMIIVTPSPYINPLSKKAIDQYAHDLFHEMTHIRQTKEGRTDDIITSQSYATRGDEKAPKEYKQSKREQEAETYAEKKMKEYKRKGKRPTGKQISRVLDLD